MTFLKNTEKKNENVQKNFLFFTIFNVNLCEFMKNNVISRKFG